MQDSNHSTHQISEITLLLKQHCEGNGEATHHLIPLVYDELRRLAQYHLNGQHHSLQPTALVHEVFLQLFAGQQIEWQNREHFFSVVSKQMRWLVVDHARRAGSQKRGGGQIKISLDDAGDAGSARPQLHDLLLLEDALTQLEQEAPRTARVVELRYFVGLSEEQTAEVMELSVRTVRREWAFAKGWLLDRMNRKK
ncbi:MAG: sigma-70 family RNA polymerase sigma factor [Acidobacteriota bacterium]